MQIEMDFHSNAGITQRSQRSARNYHAGLAAEDAVERHLETRGLRVLERRWRGPAGEIDLILTDGAVVVFVEVKTSRSHDAALQRVRRAQMRRIMLSATDYVRRLPKGQLTPMRFDVATVDMFGDVRITPNAFFDA